MSRKSLVYVSLSVGYQYGVCISLSKDVNAETKISIIWLLFCVGVISSAWR